MNLPLLLIQTYRRIPARVRRLWSFGSSTSHLALAAVVAGGGWPALFSYARLSWGPGTVFPSWTDPGPQGSAGLSWVGDGRRGSP